MQDGDRPLPQRISAAAETFGENHLVACWLAAETGVHAVSDARPLLEVTDLVEQLCGARAPYCGARVGTGACRRRRQFLGRRRRDARHGRRIRLRQIDGGAQPCCGWSSRPAAAIRINGPDIIPLGKSEMRPERRSMQIVFQDPFASLNPRMTAGDIVGEPLQRPWSRKRQAKSKRASPNCSRRSGLRADQIQEALRISSPAASASASASRARCRSAPSLIVCDEPVSALDVSIQAQVINLLIDLQRAHGFSYLFIAHDLAVVAHISHRVAVMYLGRIVEIAEKAELFANPRHPYTQALLASVPVADPKKAGG